MTILSHNRSFPFIFHFCITTPPPGEHARGQGVCRPRHRQRHLSAHTAVGTAQHARDGGREDRELHNDIFCSTREPVHQVY